MVVAIRSESIVSAREGGRDWQDSFEPERAVKKQPGMEDLSTEGTTHRRL